MQDENLVRIPQALSLPLKILKFICFSFWYGKEIERQHTGQQIKFQDRHRCSVSISKNLKIISIIKRNAIVLENMPMGC